MDKMGKMTSGTRRSYVSECTGDIMSYGPCAKTHRPEAEGDPGDPEGLAAWGWG